MPWKTTLYDYVYDKNQSFVECCAGEVPDFIADETYLGRERVRRIAERELARERHLLPQSGDTKLRINRVRNMGDGVIADIAMHKSRLFVMRGGGIYTEMRVVKERVTLRFFDGRWRITRIEHMDNESSVKPFHEQEARGPSPSLPLIHASILNNSRDNRPRKVPYNRQEVAQYADKWWNSANPAYLKFEDDCTNFASQCLFAGGAPMHYTGKRGLGWWYVGKDQHQELWSFSWAVANSLKTYATKRTVGLTGRTVAAPEQLEIGDMICYDFDGDGRFQHNTIVTAKDERGMPLVNAHTTNSARRYWSYRDSYAWTPKTKYVFVHMDDEMIAP